MSDNKNRVSGRSFGDIVRELAEGDVPEKIADAVRRRHGLEADAEVTWKESIARVLLADSLKGDKSALTQVAQILGGTAEEVERKLKSHLEKLYGIITKKVLDPQVLGVLEAIFEDYFQKLD